jgi:undecaprenyl-diphosphatase
MTVLQTIILAIVEGLTEFLPVSSTGHMIITQSLLGIPSDEFVKAFTVIIQFGAILSVVVLYWRRFFRLDHSLAPERASNVQRFLHKWNFYYKLLVAFLPAMVIGGLLNSVIDRLLGSVMVVAVMLVLGGVFMLFCDRLFDKGRENTVLTTRRALYIGLFQCIAMIPGVSRSMATIVGGMAQKLTRKDAAEFSFFLAVPTMFAATCLDVLKMVLRMHETSDTGVFVDHLGTLLLGSVVAFFVALLAIKGFVAFLTKYGFRAFGVYRIIVGGFIIVWLLLGHSLVMVD